MFFSSFVLPAFRATIKHFLFIISYYIAKIVLYILFCNIKHSKKNDLYRIFSSERIGMLLTASKCGKYEYSDYKL